MIRSRRSDAWGQPCSTRGLVDEGYRWDAAAGVGFAHGRLSIIELSPEGRQPMAAATERCVIIYNGEVYNEVYDFLDLRRDLDGHGVALRGRSETEVMLGTIERYGLMDAVRGFAGVFAFALLNRTTGTLSLVRTGLGEKPLPLRVDGPNSGVRLGAQSAASAHPMAG